MSLSQEHMRRFSAHPHQTSSGLMSGVTPAALSSRFGDGYMITVRTKSSSSVKDVVGFFNRNFPEAVLKVPV